MRSLENRVGAHQTWRIKPGRLSDVWRSSEGARGDGPGAVRPTQLAAGIEGELASLRALAHIAPTLSPGNDAMAGIQDLR
jgi:hypothetical protein